MATDLVIKIANMALALCKRNMIKTLNDPNLEAAAVSYFINEALNQAIKKESWVFNRKTFTHTVFPDISPTERGIGAHYRCYGQAPAKSQRVIGINDENDNWYTDITYDEDGQIWLPNAADKVYITCLLRISSHDEVAPVLNQVDLNEFQMYASAILAGMIAGTLMVDDSVYARITLMETKAMAGRYLSAPAATSYSTRKVDYR